jgi:PEP-CTERM putative exosortase interaction domain
MSRTLTGRRRPPLPAAVAAVAALSLLVAAAGAPPARAIVTYGSDVRLTSPPPASLLDHGYQYIGPDNTYFNPLPVAPNYFLYAKHVSGGRVGQTFQYFGQSYTIQEVIPHPTNDLALLRVDNVFTNPIPLYQPGGSEVGAEVFIAGKGGFMQKSGPIIAVDTGGSPSYAGLQNGWSLTNIGDSASRTWGQNRVNSLVGIQANGAVVSGEDYLRMTFDQPGQGDNIYGDAAQQANEAMASFGDSGAGVFMLQNGQWRLAGVVYAVDAGFYSTPTSSSPNTGAIYDARGMWEDVGGGQPRRYITGDEPVPLAFYATRISNNLDWIHANTNFTVATVPEPGTAALTAFGAGVGAAAWGVSARRRRKRA